MEMHFSSDFPFAEILESRLKFVPNVDGNLASDPELQVDRS